MVHVNFDKRITAATDPPRAITETPAFVHRATGDVLFVRASDEVAARHFGELSLAAILATVAKSPDWLAIPKFTGRLTDLGKFVREWCSENGFEAA